MRFRSTAPPRVTRTATPTRVGSVSWARGTAESLMQSRREVFPVRNTLAKSPLVRSEMVTRIPSARDLRSGRELRPALGPAVLDNRPPRTRPHARPEPVLTTSASIVRLKSSFGHGPSSINGPPHRLFETWSRNCGSLPDCGRSIAERCFSTSRRRFEKLSRITPLRLTRLAAACVG